MSDLPSEKIFSAQRKREDNARPLIVRRIAIWVVVALIVLVVLYAFPQTRWAIWMAYASPEGTEPLTASTKGGIAVTDSSGTIKKTYPIRSQSSVPIPDPFYAFVGDKLVFWSPDDQGIGIVGKEGPRAWATIYNNLGEHDQVVAMRPGTASVDLVIQDRSDTAGARAKFRPSKVVTIKIPEGTPQLQPEIADEKNGDGESVVRQSGGSFSLVGADGSNRTLLTDENAFEWDYGFGSHTLAATDNNRITIVSGSRKKSFNPAFLHSIPSVTVRGDKGEVWAEIQKPFGMGYVVLAYDNSGNLLGMRLKDSGRLKGPYQQATADRIAILENAVVQK